MSKSAVFAIPGCTQKVAREKVITVSGPDGVFREAVGLQLSLFNIGASNKKHDMLNNAKCSHCVRSSRVGTRDTDVTSEVSRG